LIVSLVLFIILISIGARTLHKGVQQKQKERADARENGTSSSTRTSEDRVLKRSSTSFRVSTAIKNYISIITILVLS
jgi:hypothetical protein